MRRVIITKNNKETKKFAEKLSRDIVKVQNKKAIVIGLIGDLGSGKTTFTQGFAKGLGIKKPVTSPTFVLEKIYEFPPKADQPLAEKTKKHRHFVHIDAYRFEKPKELLEIGFKNLADDSLNIILIEWADRVRKVLPKNCIKIIFEHKSAKERKIKIINL